MYNGLKGRFTALVKIQEFLKEIKDTKTRHFQTFSPINFTTDLKKTQFFLAGIKNKNSTIMWLHVCTPSVFRRRQSHLT